MTDTRSTLVAGAVLALATIASGCASAPPAPAKPAVTFEMKMAGILRLEDQRILRVELPPPPVVAPPRRGRAPALAPAPYAPDLAVLVTDSEARVRRRAALAIGRVGLKEGVQPLTPLLSDTEPDVRAMAAFALGLIGDATASAPLVAALADPAPLVRGRAAEALGLMDAKDAATAIGKMVAEVAAHPAVTALKADDEKMPAPAEAEAFRLGLFALVRLRAYEPLAAAVVTANGQAVSDWWPVAFALQRIADARALPALRQLARTPGRHTASYAVRGLGALKDAASAEMLAALVDAPATPLEVKVSAIRAVAQVGDPRGAAALVRLFDQPNVHPNLQLEAVTALGAIRAAEGLPIVQDLLTDSWPAMRIAALRAAAAIDQENFILVLASLERDRHWSARAALAEVLAALPAQVALERLRGMLTDEDKRVLPPVVRALSRVAPEEAATVAMARIKDPDFAVRAAMAEVIGRLKPPGAAAALREAYAAGRPDSAYDARAAALAALAEFGAAEAVETVKAALADKDWAVRRQAVTLLAKLDPAGSYQAAIRPAPVTPVVPYEDPQLISPQYSPHVFIETAKGTIEIELAVLDAPQTANNLMALARRGFFNGLQVHRVVANFVVQDGDPRGDGEGGPGYTIRDELNDRPFLRGTVGMALAGADTGGSQFFICHSPQPHLDAKYTAFGHVVNGMEVVDRIQQGDTIQRIRVWDGKTMQ